MRVLVDENVPRMTVEALKEMGHDVRDIRGTVDEGASDPWLWETAQGEERLLITTDKYFRRRRDQAHHGILIVCLRKPNKRRIHERVMHAITRFDADEWPRLCVVMRDSVQVVSKR